MYASFHLVAVVAVILKCSLHHYHATIDCEVDEMHCNTKHFHSEVKCVIYAVRTHGDDHIRTMIDRLKSGELEETEINELITFAKEHGGIEYAEQTMMELRQKAIDLLPEGIDEEVRTAIIAYMDMVINRTK